MAYERNNATQRWLEFEAMCDSIVDTDASNDPYGLDASPQNFTAPLALMYRLSGNGVYADAALALMERTDTNLSRYGDPDHQSYYFLGLAYDWLYDYAGMTEAKKAAARAKMRELSDNFYTQLNLTASGTDSDQDLLTGNLHLTFGAALYGDDDASAVVMLDRAWYGWARGYYYGEKGISNRDIVRAGLGGVYFTGMAYFPSTDIVGISGYAQTLATACGYDIVAEEPLLRPFWGNIVRGIIHLTDPTRTFIEDYGSWQDPNGLADQPWMRRTLTIAGYFARQWGDANASALAQGYNGAVDAGYYNDYFLELFYNLPEQQGHSPYEATYALPPVHFAQSPDFLLYRDGWGTDAVWGVFRGDGSVPLDQQAPDHGGFSLWYKEGFLTKGARNYEALSHGDFFNTLSIENGCTYNGASCSGTAIFDGETPAVIARHREGNASVLFAYGMLDADGQWNDRDDVYEAVRNVNTYRRHFFWTPRYVVLFDRLRTNKPLAVRYRLRAMTEPVISGNTVSQTTEAGNYRLLHKTLEPGGVTVHKADEKLLWQGVDDWIINASERQWQSYIDFNGTQSLNLLNVMQAGDNTMNAFDTLEHIDDVNSSGVRIGDWVVLFAREEALRSGVSYTVQNLSIVTRHLVCDLEAGRYVVTLNGTELGRFEVTAEDDALLFETPGALSGANSVSVAKLPWISARSRCGRSR